MLVAHNLEEQKVTLYRHELRGLLAAFAELCVLHDFLSGSPSSLSDVGGNWGADALNSFANVLDILGAPDALAQRDEIIKAYRNIPDEDEMGPEGFEEYCFDHGLEPDEPGLLDMWNEATLRRSRGMDKFIDWAEA